MRKYRFAMTGLCGLWVVLGAACSNGDVNMSHVVPGSSEEALGAGATPRSSADAGGGQTDATAAPDPVSLPGTVTMTPAGTLLCGNALCQCNNGIDDDGDGTVDGFDVECTGGIDDDEATFATGIPGDNRDPKWQDCFFDGNSGAGDDRCRYPTECLTGELAQDDPACAVTQACRDNCQPRTPNGCDCFGCCAVELPGGSQVNVTLSGSCSLEKIGDADACPVCTPSDSCGNDCGECELCPGKTQADLPASCAPAPSPEPAPSAEPPPAEPPAPPSDPNVDPPPPAFTCDGLTVCSDTSDCDSGEFCSLGCCLVVIR